MDGGDWQQRVIVFRSIQATSCDVYCLPSQVTGGHIEEEVAAALIRAVDAASGTSPAAAAAATSAGSAFVVGDKVEARFAGGVDWYGGRVTKVLGEGTFAITYENDARRYEDGASVEVGGVSIGVADGVHSRGRCATCAIAGVVGSLVGPALWIQDRCSIVQRRQRLSRRAK